MSDDIIIETDYEGRINLEYYQLRYEYKLSYDFLILIQYIIKDMFRDSKFNWKVMKGLLKENKKRFMINPELIYNVIGETKNRVNYDTLRSVVKMMSKNYIAMNSTLNPRDFHNITPEILFGQVFDFVSREIYHYVYLFDKNGLTEIEIIKNKTKLRHIMKRETEKAVKMVFPLIMPKHEKENDMDVIISNNKQMLIAHDKLKHIIENNDIEAIEDMEDLKKDDESSIDTIENIDPPVQQNVPMPISAPQIVLKQDREKVEEPIQDGGNYNPNMHVPKYVESTKPRRGIFDFGKKFLGKITG